MFQVQCVLWLREWNIWNKQHNNTEAEVDAVNQPVCRSARQTGVSLTGWISKVLFKLQLSVPILVLFLSSDTDLMCEDPILLLYSEGPKKASIWRCDSIKLHFSCLGNFVFGGWWCNSFCDIKVMTDSCWNCLPLTALNNLPVCCLLWAFYDTLYLCTLTCAWPFLDPSFMLIWLPAAAESLHASTFLPSGSGVAEKAVYIYIHTHSHILKLMVNKRTHHSCCVCVAVTWGFRAGGLGTNIWEKSGSVWHIKVWI